MMFLASILSGVIGGMGIGGGVILIPVLTSFFGFGQKDAQYLNLLYFVPVAIFALIVHKRAGNLMWKEALFMALGGLIGAFFGSFGAEIINTNILRRLFGVFLLVIGINQFRIVRKKTKVEE